ncbi:MAG TPA: FGGY family carbohydrate kinase [Euzebyales bacterium]
MRVLGIDLGTGSTKAAVVDDRGHVRGLGVAQHHIDRPEAGAAEIAPDAWLASASAATRDAMAAAGGGPVTAVGLSGQMHGVVCTDAAGLAVRPALLWPDVRASGACARYDRLPVAQRRALGNPVVPGMFGPMLAMALDADDGLRDRTRWALSPKDWLRLVLTGEAATEPSDASATLVWDVMSDTWSGAVLDALGIPGDLLPPVVASDDVAGRLTDDGARLLGLRDPVPVAAGGADTACALHGNVLPTGHVQLSVGTGAQIVVPVDLPAPVADPVTHRYRRAERSGWYAMAAIQNAGLALEWVCDVLRADWDEMHTALDTAPVGADGVTFHAYLTGERTPLNDATVRGAWQGLAANHDRATLLRSALEGVAFALRDGVDALLADDVPLGPVHLVGGGSLDPRWRHLLATVLGRPLHVRDQPHASVLGAARLAAAATGVGIDLPDPRTVAVVQPDDRTAAALYRAWSAWRGRRPGR